MKAKNVLLAGVVSTVAVMSASAGALAAHASATAKVELRHTRLGSILTSASGLTLYEFTRDRAGEDSCVKIAQCAQAWPPLQASGKPIAGPGVKSSLLSTIRLANGTRQVTYAGHALYTYVADSPGSTSYVGAKAFGGYWYAVSASGHTVK
ncbi:MAG TPA: hypothetical protein VED41_12410 [Solirubrobacteraceae bacterium]|nr:hypothetical protein [Solirubrobacteraceae bacterium]